MKTTIDTKAPDDRLFITIEVGDIGFDDNVAITKRTITGGFDPIRDLDGASGPVREESINSVFFRLDAETARALSFALAELAKSLGRK